MKLYTGVDLHLSNSYVGIIDETGKRAFMKKLPNDPGGIYRCDYKKPEW